MSSFPYEVREHFGPGTNAGPLLLSADSSPTTQLPVNELYKARFLILLDMSNSMAPFYTPGTLNTLLSQIVDVGSDTLFSQYAGSGTEPLEFAIFAFAGERRLLQLTQWSAFLDGARAVLASPAVSTDWLGSRPYPFADDSSAFYWAVPEAIRTLQERSAAGRAADLLPLQLDCLVVVSDGFDTAGFAPTGASDPLNPFVSYRQLVSAASSASQPVRYITYPPSFFSPNDATAQNAIDSRAAMASTPNSVEVTTLAGAFGLAAAAIARYTNFLSSIPDGPNNGNSLMMLEFCPAYKGAGPATGLKLSAQAAASASPAPPDVTAALPYPAPPNGRCATFTATPLPPTPTADPCDPFFPVVPTPTPFLRPSACLFFGGSACGRTSARTDLALRLDCNCAWTARPPPVKRVALCVVHPPPLRPPLPSHAPLTQAPTPPTCIPRPRRNRAAAAPTALGLACAPPRAPVSPCLFPPP